MAEALYRVSRSAALGKQMINGVSDVLINKDDAQTTAQIKAAAVAKANASVGASAVFPDDYFDTVDKVSDLAAGTFKDNEDAMVFSMGNTATKVEGS